MTFGYRKTKMNSHKMKYIEIIDMDTMNVIAKNKIAHYSGKYGKDLIGRIIVCVDGSRYEDLGSNTYWVKLMPGKY